MTTLILKASAAVPNFGLNRLAKAFNDFVQAIIDTKQMARDAQQRFPFVIE